MTVLNYGYITDGMNEFERNSKRLIDFIVAIICIILFTPLFIICYFAIKREDHGPAIFKQERIGRFGRPFYIYKLRSMKVNAEEHGPQLTMHKIDNRMTKTGRFLRHHHLDELPQLWNVVKGDMSFVGPRPERKFYIDKIMERDSRYTYLYQIRPGVTSYATLTNGYTDTMEKMLRRLQLDLDYLEHRSWTLDLKILGMTFLKIIFGKKF
jgi:lipopolysaccharide/colanic/teichoic acid biosynthesis glycosyltransferase